jgi:PTS system fructose-specific IIC component
MPVVIIPLVGSIIASGLLILFLGRPIATLMDLADRLADEPRPHVGGSSSCGVILGS